MDFTIETAMNQLRQNRDDFKVLVRDRISEATSQVDEAKRISGVIANADSEAISFLTAATAEKDINEDLKSRIMGELALHSKIKTDQGTETTKIQAVDVSEFKVA